MSSFQKLYYMKILAQKTSLYVPGARVIDKLCFWKIIWDWNIENFCLFSYAKLYSIVYEVESILFLKHCLKTTISVIWVPYEYHISHCWCHFFLFTVYLVGFCLIWINFKIRLNLQNWANYYIFCFSMW
jgi:hypothetical protein